MHVICCKGKQELSFHWNINIVQNVLEWSRIQINDVHNLQRHLQYCNHMMCLNKTTLLQQETPQIGDLMLSEHNKILYTKNAFNIFANYRLCLFFANYSHLKIKFCSIPTKSYNSNQFSGCNLRLNGRNQMIWSECCRL